MDSMLQRIILLDNHASKGFETKVKVFKALECLVQEKPFSALTVGEICAQAEIAKSTFYSHFSDKYSVVQWHYGLVSDAGASQIGRTLTWHQGHYVTTSGLFSVRHVYVSAGKSSDYNGIIPYSNRKRKGIIKETLTDYRHVRLTPKLQFQITALVAAESEAIGELLREATIVDFDEIVDCLISIVPQDLYCAMELEEKFAGISDNPWAKMFSTIEINH